MTFEKLCKISPFLCKLKIFNKNMLVSHKKC
nr:MAG TPA: hypothetical protein [Caudoviricetes sp.]